VGSFDLSDEDIERIADRVTARLLEALQPSKETPRHVSAEEACKLLGDISRRSLNRMVASRQLLTVRIGRRLRIDAASIEQLVAKSTG
jgi:excisionase family DNA binding protein